MLIQMFLRDDSPEGNIECTIDDRTLIMFQINRDSFTVKSQDIKDIKELNYSGIYFLFGYSDDDSEKKAVYVGKSTVRKNGKSLSVRTLEHIKEEVDWKWVISKVVFITTKDDSLTDTEVAFLENHFHNRVNSAQKSAQEYNTKHKSEPPSGGNISRGKQDTLNKFADNIGIILKLLGHDVLEPKNRKSPMEGDEDIFYIHYGNPNQAMCKKTPEGGFTVLAGSYIRKESTKDVGENVKKLRQSAKIDENRILQEDVSFVAPSPAAMFVLGRSSNGWTEWKNKNGDTPKSVNEKM